MKILGIRAQGGRIIIWPPGRPIVKGDPLQPEEIEWSEAQMPGYHTTEEVLNWPVSDAASLVAAIGEAEDYVNEQDDDSYLSFVVMTKAHANVDVCKLMKVTMTDDSVVYEIELH